MDYIDDGVEVLTGEKADWMKRQKSAWKDSTDYYESSLFDQWRNNLHHFRNEHAPGSKYTSDAYKNRSSLFRPKTRAAVRNHEATVASALFTNKDLIDMEGANPGNEMAAAAARIHKAILQHRLEKTIPWFQTVIGAYQDTMNYGICISKQQWKFRVHSEKSYEPAFNDDGTPVMEDGVVMAHETSIDSVLEDEPDVDLLAPENFRVDPNCDWRDPVKSSPYIIEAMPMYANDVIVQMETEDPKTGQSSWKKHSLEEVLTAGRPDTERDETVRLAREGSKREDPVDIDIDDPFQTVWVHFNIIRNDKGIDYCFYTVGTKILLTDPVPLKEVFPQGRGLYVFGCSVIESHRTNPSGIVELNRPLQEAQNDIANHRMDNVRLALYKRYKVRRGANIDLTALMRAVPGGGVLMDDVNNDIETFDMPDVTSSSYNEQDRLAAESDELLGNFSQSSVNSNRNLNETVGGMNLMSAGANQVQELGIRCFIETWVEPVLRVLVRLEGLYETDEVILAIAGEKAGMTLENITDQMLEQDLIVSVNVGMNNTNPIQKMERLSGLIQSIGQVPEMGQRTNWGELGKEIYANAGFGGGERFIIPEEEMQPPPEEPDHTLEVAQIKAQADLQVAEIRANLEQARIELEREEAAVNAQLNKYKADKTFEAAMAKIASSENIQLTALYEKLGIGEREMQMREREDNTKRSIAALREANVMSEQKLARETGEGI